MQPRKAHAGRTGLLFAAFWAAVSCAAALLLAPRAILHDEAFYLTCGLRLAHGAVPYRDFFDINPPLIMYISALPALVARLLAINVIPVFTIGVAALSAASAVLADRTFRRLSPGATALERLVVALFPLGPCAVHLDAIDPGQRDHLFVLLYYPFLLERIARFHGAPSASGWSTFGRGAIAAAGVCLKPYFLIPAIAVEAGLMLSRRRLRPLLAPEVAGALAFAAAYAAHFLFLPAPARAAFFDRILPLVLNGYSAYNGSVLTLATRVGRRVLLVPFVYVAARWLSPASLSPLLVPLLWFTGGAVVEVIAQGKGWGYHYLPANTGLLVLLAILAAGAIERAGQASPFLASRLRAAGALALIAVMLVWRPVHAYRAMDWRVYQFRPVLQKYTAPGDGVVILSTSVAHGHPAVLQTDRYFASRHLSALLWALSVEATRNGYPRGQAEQERFIAEVAEDITTHRPAAVFLDAELPCTGCEPGRLTRAFRAHPAFAGALRAYEFRGIEDGMEIYTRRLPRSASSSVFGQSSRSSRESARSASSRPSVWQGAQ